MATDETDSPYGLTKLDSDFLKTFHSTLKELRGLVISNVEFYQRGTSGIYARYYAASCILFERLQCLEPQVLEIVPRLSEFDFSTEVPGNGYRSFITIVNRCVLHLLQLCRHINVNKNNLLFRSTHYLKELEAYVETVGQLIACLGYLKQLISMTKDGDLFYDEENSEGDEILLEVEMLNTDCFYGRCLGFQFSESMQKLLQIVLVAMATFSECYEESSQVILLASSLLNSSKYFVDQELRAKQVVNVTRTADIKFCKAFWSIPESPVLTHLRSFTYPNVEVNEVITLEPDNFELPLEGSVNETVMITPACAHTGPATVSVRLISHTLREGMQVNKKRSKKGTASPSVQPKSKGLLFHCHGGGFVAQSSQSHENYLRVWARQLKMPILSVDYSLAPESPFPRALEESFYAYAWALKNPELLGWTGELVCFAGDSAGGNLVFSTALRAISYQIRVPDGIVAAYPALLVQYTPSPARLMSMIDPLLPVGILTRCLAAYAGIADKFSHALAQPIFCNPGKYETWEVIDTDDVTTESIGAQIKRETSNESDIQNADNSDVLDNHAEGVGSSGSELLNENSESCHSLEDLDDDFVVCDTEDLLQDSLNYKGTVTVIEKGTDCDTCVSDTDSKHTEILNDGNLDEAKGKVKRSEYTCDMDCSDTNRSKLQTDLLENTPEDVHEIEESSRSKKVENILEENHNENVTCETNVSSKLEYVESETIAGALEQLDSNVIITIDNIPSGTDDKSESVEDGLDTTDGYAVCQDIINEQDERYMMVDGISDMDGTFCHSLEDLTERSDGVRSDAGVTHLGIGNELLANPDHKRSDKERSNIDTDTKKVNSTIPKRSQSNPNFDPLRESREGQCDLVKQNEGLPHNGTLKSENSTVTEKNHRRAMSLDFPPFYQPTKSSSNSPSPVSRSQLSPKLPTGSRTFSPKRYSVQRKITQSPIKLFRQLPIVKNFYMSPMLAPDDLLLGLPNVYLTACHFDPLLDDSVMFAKKLSKLGKFVDLQIVDHLPHGFLSFSDTIIEAKKASSACLDKIMKVLKCDNP